MRFACCQACPTSSPSVPVWARFNCLLNKYCTEEIDLWRATISIKFNCHSTNWNVGHVCPLFASHWLGSGCPWSSLLCMFNSTSLVFVQQFWVLSIPLRVAINRPHPQFGKGGFGRLDGNPYKPMRDKHHMLLGHFVPLFIVNRNCISTPNA